MNPMTLIDYSAWVSTIALILVLYVLVKNDEKKTKKSIYQKEIDRYFKNMKWFGFSDDQIIEMLHGYSSHESMKEANRLAEKEISKHTLK